MQYEQYQPGNNSYGDSRPSADKRSQAMTTASIVLSIIAISTICCLYVSFLCGSLGIIFALLSKGGELTMSPNAKTALTISATAICLTVILTAIAFISVILRFGSFDAFWKAYTELINAYSAGWQPGSQL